jgi:hypothetical protein
MKMNYKVFVEHGVDSYWFPFLKKLYAERIVKTKDIMEANVIKDIIHSCTTDEVSIRTDENRIYVVFIAKED